MDAIMFNGPSVTASFLSGLDIIGFSSYTSAQAEWNYPSGAKYGSVYAVNSKCLPNTPLFKVGVNGSIAVGLATPSGAEYTATINIFASTFGVTNNPVGIVWYG